MDVRILGSQREIVERTFHFAHFVSSEVKFNYLIGRIKILWGKEEFLKRFISVYVCQFLLSLFYPHLKKFNFYSFPSMLVCFWEHKNKVNFVYVFSENTRKKILCN